MALVVFGLVAGGWVVLGGADPASKTPETICTITEAGEQVRRVQGVEVDQLPQGRAGDTYRPDSGCLPVDTGRTVS